MGWSHTKSTFWIGCLLQAHRYPDTNTFSRMCIIFKLCAWVCTLRPARVWHWVEAHVVGKQTRLFVGGYWVMAHGMEKWNCMPHCQDMARWNTIRFYLVVSLGFFFLSLFQKPIFEFHVRSWWRWWKTNIPGLVWSRNTPSWAPTVTHSAGLLMAFPDHKVQMATKFCLCCCWFLFDFPPVDFMVCLVCLYRPVLLRCRSW